MPHLLVSWMDGAKTKAKKSLITVVTVEINNFFVVVVNGFHTILCGGWLVSYCNAYFILALKGVFYINVELFFLLLFYQDHENFFISQLIIYHCIASIISFFIVSFKYETSSRDLP